MNEVSYIWWWLAIMGGVTIGFLVAALANISGSTPPTDHPFNNDCAYGTNPLEITTVTKEE